MVAQWDARDGSLTTWNGTQVVHFVQQGLVAALGLPAHKIRVIAPDVGGGFGTKATGYPEDLLIPAAAIVCRRPVKWTEDRREHMMAAAHARHQIHDIEIGARRDGTMVARARPHLGGPRRVQLLGHRAALQHGGASPRPPPRPARSTWSAAGW